MEVCVLEWIETTGWIPASLRPVFFSRLGNERSAKEHVVRMVLLRLPEPGAGHLALAL